MKTSMFRAITRLLCVAALGASTSLLAQVDKTPVLHMSFDNVSGATVINNGSGGSGMNGTINGTAAIVGGGRFGNALSVTGSTSSDASVRIANAVVPLNGNATWTVAMWIQTSSSGGTYAYQGGGGWGGGNTTFYLNSGGGGGTQAGGVRNSQGWVTGTNNTVNDGQWHHIVVTCNGATRNVYVDGILNTPTGDGDWSGSGSGNQFWIGGGGTGQNDGQVNLNGLIDEVYVFNQTLTQTDIQGLYNNNTLPVVPVSVTLNPTSGYRGQVFTLTATVTPPAGTITNVTANLSAINLSATASLVQSSGNVYTNTFTVPATAPVGARNLSATARTSADPFIGSGGATFTVIARPPTNAIIVANLTNTSAIEYTGVTFHFGTTNDAPNDAPFPMAYSWYTNGVLVSSNMGPNYTFLTTPAHNGMQVQAIARVADTNFSSLSVTSALVTLTVNGGSVLYNNGLKEELFRTAVVAAPRRQNVEIGNAGRPEVTRVSQADVNPSYGNNHARRYSGYFIPPTTDGYVFFVASDDDCDVFLSTDANPANKRLIAQETGWSGTRNWQTPGGGGSTVGQRRSDQWVPDPANPVFPTPYADGIPLTAGNLYYFEAVMSQGTGGDNWAVTYQTTNELALDPSAPANGTPSRMAAANNNIAFRSYPGTTMSWVIQPQATTTVYEGQSTNYTSLAATDSELLPTYQWYLNNAPIGGNTPTLTLNAIPASYNNAQIKVVASNVLSGLSITSSVATLTVLQAVFEPGWVAEKKWTNTFNIVGAENGTLGTPSITGARPGFVVGLDNPSSNLPGYDFNTLDSSLQQIGSFVAPSNGLYVFFISSHDGGNLFLSTDNTPANKRLIAQEAGWTSGWNWNTVGGGGSTVAAKRSDQFIPPGSNTPPYAAGISLTAGQRYYMELTHTTSRWGNERMGVTYRIMQSGSVTPPADGSLPNIGANNSGMSAIRCSYVAFTQQPTNATAPPMGSATFYADGTTDSLYPIISAFGYTYTQPTNKLFYQWYKNGQPIPGATSRTFTLSPVLPSDHGATIYCAMRALGYANNALQPIWSNSVTATLTVAPEAVFETGVAKVDWWTNNANRIGILNGTVGAPHRVYTTPKMIAPSGSAMDNYANRVNGFFVPPTTGNYVFFLNSDDDADLFLSTNESPANKRLIARVTGWSGSTLGWNQTGGGGDSLAQRRSDAFTDPDTGLQPYATGIPLVAGQRYYIEGVHNEGGGGDFFAATYKLTTEPDPVDGEDSRISGNAIGFYAPRIPWVAFTAHPQSPPPVGSGGNSVTFSAAGTSAPSIVIGNTGDPTPWFNNPSYLQYQWYKNGTPIPGANASTYTLYPILPADNNAQFVCGIRAIGYANNSLVPIYSNSLPAVLTVIPDNVPPTLAYAASFENTNHLEPHYVVSVTFNEWMNTTTLSNAANYSIAGATITNLFVEPNNRTVRLLLNQPPTLPLNITVSGVQDLSGNTITPGSTTPINSEKLIFSDVGFPGSDPAYPSYVSVSGVGGYVITAQGSDIWNTYDAFHFAWEWKTNNFDVVVRGVSQGHTDTFAKAGLMVRESLDPFSRNWNVVNHPAPDAVSSVGANDVGLGMREGASQASVGWKSAGAVPPPYPNAWLRLKRTGQLLQGYASSNMVNWVLLGSYDASTNVNGVLPAEVLVGICTTAHANDIVGAAPPFLFYNTAEYAGYNSSFVPSAPPAVLTITPAGANVSISWTPAGGHLEASPAVAGPGVNWQNVGTANPAVVPIGAGPQFFRVVNP
jgi:hypothetical protein